MAYQGQRGLSPTGLGIAIAINGALLALMTTMATTTIFRGVDKPFEATNVPIEVPPPPIDTPPPAERAAPAPAPLPYLPPAPLTHPGPTFETVEMPPANSAIHVGPISVPDNGVPSTMAPPIAIPAPPALVAASVDPRYRADFQPDYPAFERNQGRDGVVVVRVLVGSNGRVTAIEPVSATSDAFFEATKRRALSKWRFRPATRDGAAVESWREMTVRFTMADQ